MIALKRRKLESTIRIWSATVPIVAVAGKTNTELRCTSIGFLFRSAVPQVSIRLVPSGAPAPGGGFGTLSPASFLRQICNRW